MICLWPSILLRSLHLTVRLPSHSWKARNGDCRRYGSSMTFVAFLLTRFTRLRLVNLNSVEEITRLRKRTSPQRFRWHGILWNVISCNGLSIHAKKASAYPQH